MPRPSPVIERLEALETRLTTLTNRVVHLEAQQAIHTKLDAIITHSETIMADLTQLTAKVDELTAENAEQAAALATVLAQSDETIQTLAELKAMLDAAQGGDQTVIDALAVKVGAAVDAAKANRAALAAKMAELDIAEESADPTPDA